MFRPTRTAADLSLRLRSAVARRFGVDPRALAALRVSLGLLLLADLLRRSRSLVVFYTDAGVMPQATLHGQFPVVGRLSLHAVSGAAMVQGVLFVVAAGFAVALALGYRTRVAAVVSWLLLVSLHARNPVVVHGGDSLLRRVLFWGLFVPLGARWSVDALRARRSVDSLDAERGTDTPEQGGAGRDRASDDPVATVATAALLVQVVVVYTVNGLFKLRGDHWPGGDAVRYVFGLDHLTVLLGDALAGHAALLGVLTWLWLAMVLAAGLLVVLTGRARTLLAALFVAAHVGMALTLRLGLFPLVSVAALLPFLGPRVWDAAERAAARLRSRAPEQVRRWREGRRWRAATVAVRPRQPAPASRLRFRLRARFRLRSIRPRPRSTRLRSLRRVRRRAGPAVVAGLLAAVLLWNAVTLGWVGLPDAAAPTEHRWDMFAPEPRGAEGWFVVPGRLESGARVDALHRSPVQWDRPPDSRGYHDVRWWKYLGDVYRSGNGALRRQFVAYLCRDWNATHADDLAGLTLYYVEEPTRLDGPDPTRRVKLLEHSCGSR